MPRKKKVDPELESFIGEAYHVQEMTQTKGWEIVKRDITNFLKGANRAWAYIAKDDPRLDRLRTDVVALRKLLDMVEDYKTNCLKAEEEWLKNEFPELYIKSDIDTETPLMEEEWNGP